MLKENKGAPRLFRQAVSTMVILAMATSSLFLLSSCAHNLTYAGDGDGPIVMTDPYEGLMWTQTSEADFETGTVDGVFIDGAGDEAELMLTGMGQWTNLNPVVKPSTRALHGTATVYGTDQVILFGGYGSADYNETWVFDLSDNQWSLNDPVNRPSARHIPAMTEVWNTDEVLLFGGETYGSPYDTHYDDTWVYDFSDDQWTRMYPPAHPSIRDGAAVSMVYGSDKVVLFGGFDVNTGIGDETWVYDLSSNIWTQSTNSFRPPERNLHAMAPVYDTDYIVLYAGHDGMDSNHQDTWVYQVSTDTWYQKLPNNNPPAMCGHSLATIYGDDKVVLFGGVGSLETWVYDLSDNRWTQKIAPGQPPAVGRISTIYGTPAAVHYGGWYSDQTWQLRGYGAAGTFTSSKYDSGGSVDLHALDWSANTPPGTSVEVKLRSAPTRSELNKNDFVGPDSTWNSAYTEPDTEIWSGHDGDRWLQYKVYLLTTDINLTPSFSDITITYDLLPDPPTLNSPLDGIWINDTRPTFSWCFNGPEGISQECYLWQADDDEDFLSVDYDSGETASTTSTYSPASDLADGSWYWRVRTRGVDTAWSLFSDPYATNIDTTPPEAFTPLVEPNEWTSSTQPVVTFSTTDTGSGIDRYEVGIDGGNLAHETSPLTLPELDDGAHNITVIAYDMLNNSRTGFVDVFIDTIPPNELLIGADPDSWTSNDSPVITFSTTDGLSGMEHYRLKVDRGTFSTVESPHTLPPQVDGIHNVTVRGYDRVGNFVEDSVDVYIDTTAPLEFTPKVTPNGWTSETQPTITFKTTDQGSGLDHYEVSLDGTEFTTVLSPMILPPQDDGIHTVTVRAIDMAGNHRDASVEFCIDNLPPVISHKPVTTTKEGDLIFIRASVTDTHCGVEDVILFIKKAGDRSYTAFPMLHDGKMFSVTINGEDVTEDLEYFIKATDRSAPQNVIYYGRTGTTQIEPVPDNDIDITVEMEDDSDTENETIGEEEDDVQEDIEGRDGPIDEEDKKERVEKGGSSIILLAILVSLVVIAVALGTYIFSKKKKSR